MLVIKVSGMVIVKRTKFDVMSNTLLVATGSTATTTVRSIFAHSSIDRQKTGIDSLHPFVDTITNIFQVAYVMFMRPKSVMETWKNTQAGESTTLPHGLFDASSWIDTVAFLL
jgi:hypothetical protein